mmetsp:Transcript_5149/g.7606  ORF Transcript_5149/g.7606 Transcript_5149/m.7606 type:complete len:232 (+) Transcript_5149:340-1035(+)
MGRIEWFKSCNSVKIFALKNSIIFTLSFIDETPWLLSARIEIPSIRWIAASLAIQLSEGFMLNSTSIAAMCSEQIEVVCASNCLHIAFKRSPLRFLLDSESLPSMSPIINSCGSSSKRSSSASLIFKFGITMLVMICLSVDSSWKRLLCIGFPTREDRNLMQVVARMSCLECVVTPKSRFHTSVVKLGKNGMKGSSSLSAYRNKLSTIAACSLSMGLGSISSSGSSKRGFL